MRGSSARRGRSRQRWRDRARLTGSSAAERVTRARPGLGCRGEPRMAAPPVTRHLNARRCRTKPPTQVHSDLLTPPPQPGVHRATTPHRLRPRWRRRCSSPVSRASSVAGSCGRCSPSTPRLGSSRSSRSPSSTRRARPRRRSTASGSNSWPVTSHGAASASTRPSSSASSGEIVSVFHLAAIYNLAVPLEIAQRVNVDGTGNVLDLCAGCKNLERLNYVSTAYVAGERKGVVYEHELVLRPGASRTTTSRRSSRPSCGSADADGRDPDDDLPAGDRRR